MTNRRHPRSRLDLRLAARGALLAVAASLLAACVALPDAAELEGTTAALHDGALPLELDGRARFRQIYCALAQPQLAAAGPPERCDEVLWRLRDESPSASATEKGVPAIAPDLHVLVIGGAFSDCREPATIAYEEAIGRLAATGVRIRSTKVSGRSGPQFNARLIGSALGDEHVRRDERVVLVGYSKGAVDALQFLIDYPDLRSQVVAVIGVAGAVRGSPLAERGDWWYRTFLDEAFEGICDPGDGQVVHSLRPPIREAWLEEHPLPPEVRYYSLVGFPTAAHLSRGLAVTWRMLAEHDRRNDGQVLAADSIIPGSTLLGYVNADHWDLALDLHRQVPHLSARPEARALPRSELLEAALRFVSEDLARGSAVAAGAPVE